MFILSKLYVKRLLTGTMAALVAITFTMAVQAGGSIVNVGTNSISASANVSGASTIVIRVAGPGGYFSSQQSNTGTVMWEAPYELSDGEYRYEVFVVVGSDTEEGGDQQLHRDNGRFTVQGGTIGPVPDVGTNENDSAMTSPAEKGSLLSRIANAVIDVLIPSADAADLITSNSYWGRVIFDENASGDNTDWYLDGGSGVGYPGFRIVDDVNDAVHNFTTVFEILHSLNNLNSFMVNATGDIGMADNSLFINKSSNFLGIGTSTPAANLHIIDGSPSIRFDNGMQYFSIHANDDLTMYHNDGVNSIPFMNVENGTAQHGWVSFGRGQGGFPQAPLEVFRTDGAASLIVQEASATTAPRILQRLKNNGSVALYLENTSAAGGTWSFTLNNNNFVINNVAGNGLKIIAAADNSYRIKNKATGVETMKITANGNMAIAGLLFTGSSRSIKDNINTVEYSNILSKLDELPLSYWNYKTSNADDKHIGPMAEEFYDVFGFGESNKHIAPGDLAGIALAAAKALNEKSAIKDDQISKLSKENEQLSKTNDELKLRMQALEGKVNALMQSVTMKETLLNTMAAVQ